MSATRPNPPTTSVNMPRTKASVVERTRAAVEDVDPAAVVSDDQPARVDEYTGFGGCAHALQRAIPRGASVRELANGC